VPKSVTRTRAPLTAAVSKASLEIKDVERNMMSKDTVVKYLERRVSKMSIRNLTVYIYLQSMIIKYVSRRRAYLL
jgi:hypothetical protein